ncbi:MAG: AbrB/MazE/SpoVT family DNA-binding domain-containing protein [Symploca sp. SIO1B1]|nr:AbrB/MazE/SpoVT family DNA-binding domain-containing protein [Symploca sp. SIO1C2]NER98958.1 AbrB/MazE/SpoVT family DNA-binding domain-containing protein [Symploca sp. SIO1B1]
MISETVSSKGEIVIPLAIRNHLKIQPGSKVAFVIDEEGRVKLIPLNVPVETLSGKLHRPGMKAATTEEMDLAIAQSIASLHQE